MNREVKDHNIVVEPFLFMERGIFIKKLTRLSVHDAVGQFIVEVSLGFACLARSRKFVGNKRVLFDKGL